MAAGRGGHRSSYPFPAMTFRRYEKVMPMTDTEAIRLYVAAGNPREDWDAMDDRDRWPWRKMALEKGKRDGPVATPAGT